MIDAENAVPSRFDGKRIINHIETYQILPQHLKRGGQTPNGIGFLSDHRGMFVDIHLEGLLCLTPDKPAGSEPWILKSGNLKTVETYLTNLKSKLESQNVFQRVSKLWRDIQNGNISEFGRNEYDKLDATITECMIASEKQLTPPDVSGKSSEQIRILSKIKYYKLLF